MTARFEHIPLAGLQFVWPMVRRRIVALAAATNEPWEAGDVLDELMLGRAELWTTPHAETFLVLCVSEAPYTRDLHVWIACSEAQNRAREFLAQVLEIGAERGCDRMVFESPRRWERELPGIQVRHLYTMNIGGEHVRR